MVRFCARCNFHHHHHHHHHQKHPSSMMGVSFSRRVHPVVAPSRWRDRLPSSSSHHHQYHRNVPQTSVTSSPRHMKRMHPYYTNTHAHAHTHKHTIYTRISFYLLSQNRAFLRPPHNTVRDERRVKFVKHVSPKTSSLFSSFQDALITRKHALLRRIILVLARTHRRAAASQIVTSRDDLLFFVFFRC